MQVMCRMKKRLLLFFLFFLALFLELIAGRFFTLFGIRPPLVALAVFASYWFLSLFERVMLGFAGGIFMESVVVSAPGSYSALFVFLAFAADMVKNFSLSPHSSGMRAAGTCVLLFLFLNLVPLTNMFFLRIQGLQNHVTGAMVFSTLVGSLFWACFSLLFLLPFSYRKMPWFVS